jgi:hypothetical protein
MDRWAVGNCVIAYSPSIGMCSAYQGSVPLDTHESSPTQLHLALMTDDALRKRSSPFPINRGYRKRSRRSVARGAGVVFPDKRKPTIYRHLKERLLELSILNVGILLANPHVPKLVYPTCLL